ncbi:hypothetical protein JXA47_11735 [Candidatus Sumerlaeota bacterium]|nr:hypothetical protein [Candidatus Sumerlaeota bacterium]
MTPLFAQIDDWYIGFALLAAWICVGLMVLIVQRDRRRRRAERERRERGEDGQGISEDDRPPRP